jgi:hypothetical protein
MILLPFLSIKSMAVSAFHILGIRSAVASLSPLNQGAIRLPEQIAGSQDSFLGKTNSYSPPDTPIHRVASCWRCSSMVQIPQGISSNFALCLYFSSDLPHIRCISVTLVTNPTFSNHFSRYLGMITQDSKTLLRKLHFRCLLPIQ